MAFPTVTATAVTTAGSSSSGTQNVLMPATVNVDDILVAWLRSSSTGDHTWPGDWNVFFNESPLGTNQTSCAWKVAAGTEDGTNVGVTAASSKYSAIAYAIGGSAGGLYSPECSTRAAATSTSPNPPSFAPSYGTALDILWLWCGGWEGEQTSPPTGNPTNYTNPIGSSSGTAGAVTTNTRCASARRNLNGTTEDAPAWTISVSDEWSAWVVAIPPFVAAPDVAQPHLNEPNMIVEQAVRRAFQARKY